MKKNIISAFCLLLLTTSSVSAFSDLAVNDNFYLPATYLTEKKVIKGYADGSFGVNKPINRAEALKVILIAANLKINENFAGKFKDVPQDAWFAKYVETAAAKNIVSGDGNTGNFMPARQVNKAEFLKMVLQAFDVSLEKYQKVMNVQPADVQDADWFAPYMKFAAKFKIIDLDAEKKSNPAKFLTRGEAIEILFRILKKGRGLDPQILLNIAEQHLIFTLNNIIKDDTLNASLNLEISEKIMVVLNDFLPNNTTVKFSEKVTEAIKSLLGAYVSGKNKDLDAVIKASSDTWRLANEAEQISPEKKSLAITNKIKDLAHSLAEEARKLKEKPE